MTQLFGILEFSDYAIIGVIVAICAGGAAYTRRQEAGLWLLKRQLEAVEQKLDALLKHQGVELPPPPPSGLSPEVELLARDPDSKIAAIRLYRKQNPGVGLAEAKARIEEFSAGRL